MQNTLLSPAGNQCLRVHNHSPGNTGLDPRPRIIAHVSVTYKASNCRDRRSITGEAIARSRCLSLHRKLFLHSWNPQATASCNSPATFATQAPRACAAATSGMVVISYVLSSASYKNSECKSSADSRHAVRTGFPSSARGPWLLSVDTP